MKKKVTRNHEEKFCRRLPVTLGVTAGTRERHLLVEKGESAASNAGKGSCFEAKMSKDCVNYNL